MAKKESEELKIAELDIQQKKNEIQKDLENNIKDLKIDLDKKAVKQSKINGIFEKCEIKKTQAAE